MRNFDEIYFAMKRKGENRFSLLELIKIFDNEVSWVGTTQQLLEIKSLSHEVTGIRAGDCSACNLDAVKNMVKWVKQNEPNIKIKK
tara:strand:- start:272 stop:529 length:258 start_codon:yes stop_codon:yes gene_type:complete